MLEICFPYFYLWKVEALKVHHNCILYSVIGDKTKLTPYKQTFVIIRNYDLSYNFKWIIRNINYVYALSDFVLKSGSYVLLHCGYNITLKFMYFINKNKSIIH